MTGIAMIDKYLLLDRRHEHWVLASMLLVLHAALAAGLETRLAHALMTAHLGLFFLWQPIWQREQRLDVRAVVVIAILVGGALLALDWPFMFAWLVLLIGIVAGRSFSTRQERYVYMLSLAILVCELLITCTHALFLSAPLAPALTASFHVGLYLLPAALYAIPPITVPPREPFPVDFFRGITFALMTALLAVFSVLMTVRFEIEYPTALVATLIALGLFLFFLSWITAPGAGSFGLFAVWEKSVLNIGTPFEAWLGNIANLAAQQSAPDAFLDAALEELVDIPWISGVAWRAGVTEGMRGSPSRHQLLIETVPLTVTLYTERSFSSALLIHCRLLIQVLSHFYVAKQREREEANAAHLRAIYETGARVTHDIKNLLQSLQTMAIAVERSDGAHERGFALLKRRLPDIVTRLRLALEKLQRPAPQAASQQTVAQWWQGLRERIGDSEIALAADLDEPALRVPVECFDSVTDNLLDNVRHKIAAGEARHARVDVSARGGRVCCRVTDDGSVIDADIARAMFKQPLASAQGLGIGLFQAAAQARAAGCELALVDNRAGHVSFELRT